MAVKVAAEVGGVLGIVLMKSFFSGGGFYGVAPMNPDSVDEGASCRPIHRYILELLALDSRSSCHLRRIYP